jgi:PAS domain S-box-containing protein
VVETALDLVAIIDRAGVFQFASSSHVPILGYAPDELVGRSVMEFVHPDDRAVVAADVAAADTNPAAARVTSFRMRHRDGSWRFIEALGKALDGEARLGIVESRDVTARVQAEEALRFFITKPIRAATVFDVIDSAVGAGAPVDRVEGMSAELEPGRPACGGA